MVVPYIGYFEHLKNGDYSNLPQKIAKTVFRLRKEKAQGDKY